MFFFILPVGVNYRTQRWPVVTFSLMGVCIAVHIWSMVLWGMGTESYMWWMKTLWFIPSHASVITVFTNLFVHASIFHLLGNMVYLFLFGATTEDIIGRGWFLLLYLVGGAAAVFGHVALTAGHFASNIPLGGASGAISTCMGAFLILLPKVEIDFKWFAWVIFRPFGGEFELSSWVVMSFWFLSDLFSALLQTSKDAASEGTAFGAHIAGFLLGMAVIASVKGLKHARAKSDAAPEPVVPLATTPVRVSVPPTPDRPFLVFQNNKEFGPYNTAEMEQYLRDGSILAEALYWRLGMPEWRPIAELPIQPLAS